MDGRTTAPTLNVLDALADDAGVDAHDLEPPLYSAVDPEALDRLVGSATDVTVTFEYGDQAVTVSSDGSVTLGNGAGTGGVHE